MNLFKMRSFYPEHRVRINICQAKLRLALHYWWRGTTLQRENIEGQQASFLAQRYVDAERTYLKNAEEFQALLYPPNEKIHRWLPL